MSEDDFPRRDGFRQGYQRVIETKRHWRGEPPPAPYPLSTPERSRWIAGWHEGMDLGMKHVEEFYAFLETMTGESVE